MLFQPFYQCMLQSFCLPFLFQSVGEYDILESTCHHKRDWLRKGRSYISLGEYDKAKEYLEKALVIRMKIDDKQGEATIYSNLGALCKCLGEYDKVKNAFHRKKNSDKRGQGSLYGNLGTVFMSLGECDKAKEYL